MKILLRLRKIFNPSTSSGPYGLW